MAILPIDDFLATPGPILDVRSPGEYTQGHIPGAVSFPLFSDDERAQVGICYKHQGRAAAVELGFDLAGPKFGGFLRQATAIAPGRQVRVHCWRGGMRSQGVAWVLGMGGFTVTTLAGGYKSFRRWVRSQVATPRPMVLLGGMTGTGKTQVLQALQALGEATLDLEAWANHRGSSYGGLGSHPQPSVEQFENLIAWHWASLPRDRPVWVEAESRRIGLCRVPEELFQQMAAAPVVEITRSLGERLTLLVDMYGGVAVQDLIAATQRIQKRLGGQRTQGAIAQLQQGDLRAAFALVLDYYDRTYRYDLTKRQPHLLAQVDITGDTPAIAAQKLQALIADLGYPCP